MRGILKYVLMTFGLGFVAWMIYSTGIDSIIENLQKIGLLFVPIIALWIIVYAMNTFANALIVKSSGTRIPFGRLFAVNVAGFAINYITPFVALGGETYRAGAMSGDLGKTKSVSATILYNMLHVLSHLFFWLTGTIIFVSTSAPTSENLATAGIIGLILILLIVFFFARHKSGIFRSLFNLLGKSKRIDNYLSRHEKRVAEFEEMDDTIRSFYSDNRRGFFGALIWEYMARVFASLEILLILRAIGVSIGFLDAVYINAFSSLIMNLAFFMPLESGSREAGMMLSMGSLSAQPEIGIFISIVNRIREAVWIVIGMICLKFGEKKN